MRQLEVLHKDIIYYISKEFFGASFLVQLSPDFGCSGFLHHIKGEKRVPVKSRFYDVPQLDPQLTYANIN